MRLMPSAPQEGLDVILLPYGGQGGDGNGGGGGGAGGAGTTTPQRTRMAGSLHVALLSSARSPEATTFQGIHAPRFMPVHSLMGALTIQAVPQ